MNRILIVEDDQFFREAVQGILMVEYEVTAASNLKTAKTALDAAKFDLVLLDLGLPDGSGLELCTYIKQFKQRENTPVLIVSGNSDVITQIMGLDMGTDDYIVKPFAKEELFVRIRAKLHRTA